MYGGASCHKVITPPPPPARQGAAILTETLGKHAPSYATVKNWVVQFKRGDFSTCDAPRPGRPKTVTTPEIIDQINELILEDRRISAKTIAEQLGISRERGGPNMHEDLYMRKLSAKWVPKCLNADQKRQRSQSCEKHLEFFSARS
jgi:histone-lysine N-methyltransferase SETMAR